MELRQATRPELRRAYECDLTASFPREELKPLSAIERMLDEGRYLPLILTEEEKVLGEAFLWLGEDNYWLLDYLCVSAAGRNRGLGAEMLRLLRENYPQAVILWESEAPTDDPAKDEMILRRLGFYARNGAKMLAYDSAAFGVHYKTLVSSAQPIDEGEVLRHHQDIYRKSFTPEQYARYIQIPLAPGEALKPPVPWRQGEGE